MTPRRSPLVALLGVLFALAPVAPARADSAYSAVATFTETPIRIDGRLDEAAWQQAQVLDRWHQTRVQIGALAREQTEVRILYDRDNLYFGFHCLDSQPGKIAAYTVQNEAFLHQDDNVTIIIDTFLDHRNAYYFWTNPLGVRTDGRIVNDGENFSTDWQGEWEAKGSTTGDGWIVEVRIPFRNFQYQNQPEHVFGLLLDREQVRLQEWSNWTPDGVNSAKVSRYPHLRGLRGIRPRSLLSVTGYAAASSDISDREARSAAVMDRSGSGQGAAAAFLGNAGLDLRLTPASWASLRLTINPDFAQVDVDQDVLWLDVVQRQLPERRPFFLEGADLFVSPIRLFYSRLLAPRPDDRVLVGLQAAGKRAGWGFSVMDVQTQEHRADQTLENVNAAAIRVQRDIGRRSQVSAVALGRFGDQKLGNLGLDANLNLFEEVFFLGQASLSLGPQGGASVDQSAYHAELHRFATNSEFWLQFEDIGARFVAPLGYVPYTDLRSLYAHGNLTWFNPLKWPVLQRVDVFYEEQWWWNHQGDKRRENRSLSLAPFLSDDLSVSLAGQLDRYLGFDTLVGTLGFTVFPNRWEGLTVNGLYGNLYGSRFAGFRATLNLKFGPHLLARLSGFATWASEIPRDSPLRPAAPAGVTPGAAVATETSGYQWSVYGQARYQFNPNLYLRLTYQRGSVVNLKDLGQIEGQIVDATLGWHYRVGSDAFLVYTQQPLPGAQDHRILAKVSYEY